MLDLLKTIFAGVAVLALILNLIAFLYEKRKTRKLQSIEALYRWSNKIDSKLGAARQLLIKLSEDDIQKIINREKIDIPESGCKEFCEMIFDPAPIADNGRISLSSKQVCCLRSLIITYTNNIEITLEYWRKGVCDRETIEEQFAFIFDEKGKQDVIVRFVKLVGIDHFPSLKAFINRKKKEIKISKDI